MRKISILPIIAVSIMSLSACTTTDFISSTSSTLDAVTPDVTLNNFVNTRFAAIKKEAAAGSGENIAVLADLMGQKDSDHFSGWMQTNYDVLFGDIQKPVELISRIENEKGKASI